MMQMTANRRRKTVPLLALAAAMGAALVSGCSSGSDGPGDEDQIRDVTQQVTDAYTAKDVDGWTAGLCAETADKVRARGIDENKPGMNLVSVESISVDTDADTATAMVTVDENGRNITDKVGYVREGGDWKFCTQEK